MLIYQSHIDGLRIVDRLTDATEYQKYFLWLMAAQQVEYQMKIDNRLVGIAKGVGVEFKK